MKQKKKSTAVTIMQVFPETTAQMAMETQNPAARLEWVSCSEPAKL